MHPDETGTAAQILILWSYWIASTGCMQSARSTLPGKIIDYNGFEGESGGG